MDKLKQRIKKHQDEIKRLSAIVNNKDEKDYIKEACSKKIKQLKSAIKILNSKLQKLSV